MHSTYLYSFFCRCYYKIYSEICFIGQQEVNALVKKLRSAFPMKDKKVKSSNKTKLENTDKDEDEEIDDSLAEVLQRVKKAKKKKTDLSLPDINLEELVAHFLCVICRHIFILLQ